MTGRQYISASTLALAGGLGTCGAATFVPFFPWYLAVIVAVGAMPYILRRALATVGKPGPGDLEAAGRVLGWLSLVACGGGGFLAGAVLPAMNPDHRPGVSMGLAWEIAPLGLAAGAIIGLPVMFLIRFLTTRLAQQSDTP